MAILLIISCLAQPACIADGQDLSGYSYVKTHLIQGSSNSSQFDYPIMLVVHRGMGIDSGRHVYLNQRPLSWPDDFRFTDSLGNPLDYRVESSDTGKVVVWVKVDCIPQSPGTTSIQIYYGKAGDSGASNSTIVIGSHTADEPFHKDWSAERAISGSMPVVKPTAIGVTSPPSAAPAQQPVTAQSWLSPTGIPLLGLVVLIVAIGAFLSGLLAILMVIDLLKNTSRWR